MTKYVVEFSADLDKDSFFLVQTTALKVQFEKVHPDKAIYLNYEVPLLRKLNKETLKKIHLMKKHFGSLILSVDVNKKS